MKFRLYDLKWEPFPEIHDKLDRILAKWEGTPHSDGQQSPGLKGGVDCIRFVTAVLDELEDSSFREIKTLGPYTAIHSVPVATRVMLEILRAYSPLGRVSDGVVQPGDVVVVGPENSAPGHVMVVGPRPGELWHTAASVQRTGMGGYLKLLHAYRKSNREVWSRV